MVNGSNCGKGTKGFFSDFSSRYLSLREWTFTAQKQYKNRYKEIKLCFNHVTQSSEESKLYDLPVSLYLYIKNLLILECGLFDLSVFLFIFYFTSLWQEWHKSVLCFSMHMDNSSAHAFRKCFQPKAVAFSLLKPTVCSQYKSAALHLAVNSIGRSAV